MRPRPIVAVALSALGMACSTPPTRTHNPPEPALQPVGFEAFEPLNGRAGPNFIFRADGGCTAYAKDQGGTPKGEPRTEAIACPPHMEDPSWDACRGGVVTLGATVDAPCLCSVAANPPPPTREIACPKH